MHQGYLGSEAGLTNAVQENLERYTLVKKKSFEVGPLKGEPDRREYQKTHLFFFQKKARLNKYHYVNFGVTSRHSKLASNVTFYPRWF